MQAQLRNMQALGHVRRRVGVRSDETPDELEREADVLVEGPRGVRDLLQALLD